MIKQVKYQHRLRKTEICNDFLHGYNFQKQFFLIKSFLTNQTNSYQMSSLMNFYQMFLDQSDLIDLHFKFCKPVIFCKNKADCVTAGDDKIYNYLKV